MVVSATDEAILVGTSTLNILENDGQWKMHNFWWLSGVETT